MRRVRSAATLFAAIVFTMASVAVATAAPKTVEPGNAKAEQFETPNACGCHASLVEQWTKSMHAQALVDPLYVTKRDEANKASDGALGAFCDTCHAPAATMAGSAEGLNLDAGSGITCSFCHQVTGLASDWPANTNHLVEADGTKRAQIKDPDAPHPAEYSEFHETAEFCGGCHNVDHPINGMHLEATYTEWRESPWAEEGVTCQDCHMSREPGVIGPFTGAAAGGAPERPNMYAMTFIGAQVALGDSENAVKLLRSAATVEIEAPEVLPQGGAEAVVKVTNVGAGHYLPTGLTEVREMWLEVYTEDASGAKSELGTRMFVTILEDDEGNSPVELWEATKIKSDDRIPPRESVTETYTISLPAGTDSTTVKAVLRYRSASDEFAKKAGVENPVTDMASAEQAVFVSDEAKVAASQGETGQGEFFDANNLAVILVGLAVIIGLIAWFVIRGRKASA